MKDLKYLIVFFVVSILIASCSPDQGDYNVEEFIGTYSVSVTEQMTLGNNSVMTTDSGILTISKISANSVQLSGYISTTGSVLGSMLYLNPSKTSDSSGNIITYSPAILNGNILTFTANQSGQIAYYGTMYSCHSTWIYTAIKL